jgi:Ribonuclease G/E
MPDRTLLIERSPGELRAALLHGDDPVQVDHYRDHAPPLEGALFHGRVRRVEPGLSAAFVDLDGRHEGFLRARAIADRPKGVPIASLVQEGAAIVVRVLNEPPGDGDKLPRVATLDHAAVAALRNRGPLPAPPACFDAGPLPLDRVLAAHVATADRIVCNDGASIGVVRRFLDANGVTAAVERQSGDLFELFGVEAALDLALAPVVALPGGGSLIFEPGATLCAIDVNSGDRTASSGQAARDANLAAVPVIARQLRLREIAGAIVIDFLKLDRAADREALLAALRAALADDPSTCHVLGLSRLGLVEMTRRRRQVSLADRLLRPALSAGPRADTVACRILRDLAARSRRGIGRFSVRTAPDVVALLQGAMAPGLAESVAWSHASVTLVADDAMSSGRYEFDEPDGRAAENGETRHG